MGELETAALRLALFALAFVAAVLGIWWFRRQRSEPAVPKGPRLAGESRLPRLSRKPREIEEEVEIAPSRLARVSRKTEPDWLNEPDPYVEESEAEAVAGEPAENIESAAVEPAPTVEEMLESAATEVEEQAHRIEDPVEDDPQTTAPYESAEPQRAEAAIVRLVPQIPLRDAILTRSLLGGRPRLPQGMEWPHVDGRPGDFLAQVSCADLPADLWDGLGPRQGWLAFFANPDSGAPLVIHLTEDGPPRDPPREAGPAYFGPQGGLRFGELASLTIQAFPEWPVDLVVVRPGEDDPRDNADPDGPARDLYEQGYDIADPAFHPFDWDSMLAMAQILERRLERLPEVPGDHGTDCNADVRERAKEIITIIRDSAGRMEFSATDATAVMSALHAINWTKTLYSADPESGEERVDTLTLPLTRHHPDASLWVHDYQAVLFDHAKHAWCQNPNRLSAPARAFYEPLWQEMAAREMAGMGHVPFHYIHDFDEERDVVLIELPTSGLMSRIVGDAHHLVLTMRKADLAAGDFSKPRVHISN